jgi:hypothetical protein
MLAYAGDRTLAAARAGSSDPGRIPADERARLRQRVRGLAERFEALWRRRYRPGGRADSLSIFDQMAEELED